MRMGFGLLSLLLALLIVGVLVKKQLASTKEVVPALHIQGAASAPTGNVREQSQRIQQQYKEALDAAMQPRKMPDDN